MIEHHYTVDGTKANCPCVGKHIPKAMELHRHHVWPLGEGGPDVKENLVIICPTMHSNIHRLWRLYEDNGGRPPWELIRGYSEFAREVVERGREQRRAHNQTIRNHTHTSTIIPDSVRDEND